MWKCTRDKFSSKEIGIHNVSADLAYQDEKLQATAGTRIDICRLPNLTGRCACLATWTSWILLWRCKADVPCDAGRDGRMDVGVGLEWYCTW